MRFFPTRDPRTVGWFGAGNWAMYFLIIGLYVSIMGIVLPKYMLTRRKFKIVGVIRAYNLILIFVNVYFFAEVAKLTYLTGKYSWICQNVGKPKENIALVKLLHRFMFVRIFELLDTAFFILRKKFKHASFRNISHHSISIFLPWYGITYGIDGQTCLMVLINMLVHMIIYIYYFLATFEDLKPFLAWKRYLSIVQIIQFFIIITHMSLPIFVDCDFPILNSLVNISAYVYFLVMFKVFYGTTYRSGDRRGDLSINSMISFGTSSSTRDTKQRM